MSSRSGSSIEYRTPSRRALVAVAFIAVATLAGCSADPKTTAGDGAADVDDAPVVALEAADAAGTDATAPTYLWAQTAASGSLTGSDDELTLVLQGVPDHLTRFTDRPMRDASVVAPEDTARRWGEFFETSAPNATLSYTADGFDTQQIIVLTLGQPIYDADAATMTYPATRVHMVTDDLPDTTRHIEPPAVATPSKFGPASLFIDGGSPPCWNVPSGVAMQCRGASLAGKTLNATGAHEGSSFNHANLQGAKMSNVDWTGTDFGFADLAGADLSNSNLTGINFGTASWETLDLSGSNLTRANFACSTGAMNGVDLTGTTLKGATFDYWQGVMFGWDPGTNPSNGAIVLPEAASRCGNG